jgi:type I restriction enzyme S subunit
LGEIIEDYVEKTVVQNQYPVLTSSQQRGIIFQEDYFAGRQATTDENIGYFVLPKGYFTYRSRSDNNVFVFNRNDLIDKGIISYFYPVFRLKNADSNFFLRRVNNGIQRQITMAAEGTGQHVLSLKKFKDIVALFPSVEEQAHIGAFFDHLDRLLTLHQREGKKMHQTRKHSVARLSRATATIKVMGGNA